MERSARTRLVSALLLFLVLATGFVLGVAVDRQLQAQGEESETESSAASSEGERGERGSEDRSRRGSSGRGRSLIVEQVGLSADQKEQVDSIVARFRTEMRDLHREIDEAYSAQYRVVLVRTRDEIRAVLTPEQRAEYDRLLQEEDQRRETRRRDSSSNSDHQRGQG
jgi:Spy/CpxP family protein refolding chaperone